MHNLNNMQIYIDENKVHSKIGPASYKHTKSNRKNPNRNNPLENKPMGLFWKSDYKSIKRRKIPVYLNKFCKFYQIFGSKNSVLP